MKRRIFGILCGITVLVVLTGCSRSHDVPGITPVRIMPAITRVSGLDFETGDIIGLTITRSSGIYAENVQMAYDGTVFSAPDLEWYGESSDPATLSAYYPYTQEGAPTFFRVSADQSGGIESSDLLSAFKPGVTPTESAVGMVFRHLFSTIRIVVTNKTSSPVSELKLGGTVLEADVDLAAQTATVKSGAVAADIKTLALTPDQSYQAVVVPQTAALTLSVTTADGKVRSASFVSNALLSGKYYTISLLVEQDRLIPTLSGEVTDWESGGALTPNTGGEGNENGESGNENGGETGETMICMGETYPTAAIGDRVWMAENLRNVPAVSGGYWYPDAATDENLKKYGLLYDFATAQEMCPEGWRLPDEADFEALIAALPEPYDDFVPLAGLYSQNSGKSLYFGTRGYLMGATQGASESLRKYLQNNSSGAKSLLLQESNIVNGVSVRFVRNE